MTNNSSTQKKLTSIIEEFSAHLLTAGMDEENAGFLVGRLLRKSAEASAEKLQKELTKDEMAYLEKISEEEEKDTKIKQLFLEKVGISMEDYQKKFVEDWYEEYKKA